MFNTELNINYIQSIENIFRDDIKFHSSELLSSRDLAY